MQPNPASQRLLMMLTAVITFLAGVFAAHGQINLFLAMLVMLFLAWFVVLFLDFRVKLDRHETQKAKPDCASSKRGV
jgi:hypothetical protein